MGKAILLYNSKYSINSIKNTIAVFYGSGLIAKAYKLDIVAEPEDIANRLVISMNRYPDIPLASDAYKQLHAYFFPLPILPGALGGFNSGNIFDIFNWLMLVSNFMLVISLFRR